MPPIHTTHSVYNSSISPNYGCNKFSNMSSVRTISLDRIFSRNLNSFPTVPETRLIRESLSNKYSNSSFVRNIVSQNLSLGTRTDLQLNSNYENFHNNNEFISKTCLPRISRCDESSKYVYFPKQYNKESYNSLGNDLTSWKDKDNLKSTMTNMPKNERLICYPSLQFPFNNLNDDRPSLSRNSFGRTYKSTNIISQLKMKSLFKDEIADSDLNNEKYNMYAENSLYTKPQYQATSSKRNSSGSSSEHNTRNTFGRIASNQSQDRIDIGSLVKDGGLIGLKNIGNTCLSNTRPLLEYILSNSYLDDINTTTSNMKGALMKAFASLIQELWNIKNNNTAISTSALKIQIQRFAPRFMGYNQQDAQEFLRYLLEGLHEDVMVLKIKETFEFSSSEEQKAVESWKRYLKLENSKIVDFFVGQLKSTLHCTKCNYSSVTFDPFWDLSLPIPSTGTQIQLQQCFDLFTREEILDGNEKPICSKCKTRCKCIKRFTIHRFPKILVVHLKRFSPSERYRGKLSCEINFPLTGLNLRPYASSHDHAPVYRLYGVANHSGTSYSGHYTAFCRHPYNSQWYEFNDSHVNRISSHNVVNSEAYLLFYELISSN